jgi:hypothetical protein
MRQSSKGPIAPAPLVGDQAAGSGELLECFHEHHEEARTGLDVIVANVRRDGEQTGERGRRCGHEPIARFAPCVAHGVHSWHGSERIESRAARTRFDVIEAEAARLREVVVR